MGLTSKQHACPSVVESSASIAAHKHRGCSSARKKAARSKMSWIRLVFQELEGRLRDAQMSAKQSNDQPDPYLVGKPL